MPYKKPAESKALILAAAMTVARRTGYMNMTRTQIASHIDVSDALVTHYWGTMNQLRRAVMREAVRTDDAIVIAQGLAHGDSNAKKASPAVRKQIAAAIA